MLVPVHRITPPQPAVPRCIPFDVPSNADDNGPDAMEPAPRAKE